MTSMQKKQEHILTKLQQVIENGEKMSKALEYRRRSSSTSPSRGTSSIQCFRCKGNHLVRDCPVPKPDLYASDDKKRVQFVESDNNLDLLNDSGSDDEA